MITLLKSHELYNKCDTSKFKFQNTNALKFNNKIIGQDRAIESINMALGIKHKGYNLFVMGESGTGRHFLLEKLLKEKTKNDPVACDWCYVNNFSDYTKPLALELPSGMGVKLKKDMQDFIALLQLKLPQTFKQKEYVKIKKELEDATKIEQDKLFFKIKDEAREDDIFINDTTAGVTISPLKEGKTLNQEEFQSLSLNDREKVERKILAYKKRIDESAKNEMEISKGFMEKLKNIDNDFAKHTIEKCAKGIRQKYSEIESVTSYLNEVCKDVLDNFADFVKQENVPSNNAMENLLTQSLETQVSFDIYNVNVFVNNEALKNAPIVYEYNPTYSNLFGRIEHVSHMGTLSTDFNFVKAGSLHRANGGYLIIDARALLFQPYSWEGLKRMIQSGKIQMESVEESMGLTSSVTLNPQSIELDAKIVLVGSSFIYYLLYDEDPDFKKLFKIEADFENKIERNNQNTLLYANVIATLLQKYNLLSMTKKAVGRVVEYGARIVDDSKALSTNFSKITDLLHEANYIALNRGGKNIKNDDVLEALSLRIKRSQRIKEDIYTQIKNETIQINTSGHKVGQINGLSVIDFGNYAFCLPVKISALTYVGRGGVVNIEREVDLSGSIHSKGVMILSSYLASRYSHDCPLSLNASLVFEQSYSIIDGDSASLAELYALFSSLTNVPIAQNFAITGSINQNGDVQAIGGVNEKIEGFYDVCKLKDKNVKANVIIPASNVRDLMLKEEVLESVKRGQFKVYSIKHVDDGIKLLMGMDAGKQNANGKFTKGSFNELIAKKLVEFSQLSLKEPKSKA
jgi:lon-related putative ATP-dependent protease